MGEKVVTGVVLGLLGVVEFRVDGRVVDVGHARQRCVLAVLAVESNRVVSVDALVARVWGDRAPQRARETLYNYLSRLRRALDPFSGVSLTRQPGGYVLTVDPMVVDVHRFHHLVAQARAADDQDQALVLFEQALGLWRGEPFAGVDTAWVNELRDSLERDRFAAELDCTDLYLRRGQHNWLLGELVARARAHPLDERVAGQVMLALYQCGRQAEALAHFQRLRERLAEELGIDPNPKLQQRYEQILHSDPALIDSPAVETVSASRPVPRQLPAYTRHFVGRAAELHQLDTLLDTAGGGGTVVITAIDGIAGIGKTALALHWAHQIAQRFVDGQLYVNLRGFDPTNTPMHPTEALRGFLEALGTSPAPIPTDLEAQAGLYRSLLTDRRVLIVLDNACDTEQIRPLLPAGPRCLVVITSRNQLPGLIIQQGARPLTLDVLSPPEARTLLARHLGPQRLNAEPDAVIELIKHCAGLPLALAIVAARATLHPGLALRVLAKELADEHSRLAALDTGDPTTSVQALFSWSYHHLSPPAKTMFRLLGLHPGPDIALSAASHLNAIPPQQAQDALNELTRAHLLTQHTLGRYTFHDLLCAYATHLTNTHDTPKDQHAALTRLFDHYLHTATATMHVLQPAGHHRPFPRPSVPPTPPVTDSVSAQHWLNTERANLAAIITYTATHGWHTHTTQLANAVLLYNLEASAFYPQALTLYTHVQHAAQHTNDQTTEARALTHLGIIHWWQGHYPQALDHHQQALTLCREAGDRVGEAFAINGLGLVYLHQGRYPQALDHLQKALTLCRDTGDRAGEALALNCLGTVYRRQGRYPQALDHHQQALTLCRDTGDRAGEAVALSGLGTVYAQQSGYPEALDHLQKALTLCREACDRVGEAFALNGLGLVYRRQGRYPQALDHHQQALTLCRQAGDRSGEAVALNSLGVVYGRQGHYQQALDHFQQALTLCRETGERADEAEILNGLGEAHHAHGQLNQAHTHHTAALTLATKIGDPYEQARAHHGLAHTHHTTGHRDHAHHHWQQALSLYTNLKIPQPDNLTEQLT